MSLASYSFLLSLGRKDPLSGRGQDVIDTEWWRGLPSWGSLIWARTLSGRPDLIQGGLLTTLDSEWLTGSCLAWVVVVLVMWY